MSFFVIRFTVEYSDRNCRALSSRLPVPDGFGMDLGYVHLSLQLCKILKQFVTFMLFSGHLRICFTLPTAAVFAS